MSRRTGRGIVEFAACSRLPMLVHMAGAFAVALYAASAGNTADFLCAKYSLLSGGDDDD